MKIAISSDDKSTIRSGYFGRSQYFFTFTIIENKIIAEEVLSNPYCESEETSQQFQGIRSFLQDCDIFIGKSLGRDSLQKMKTEGITFLLTQIELISEAMAAYLSRAYHNFLIWDEDKKRFIMFSEKRTENNKTNYAGN